MNVDYTKDLRRIPAGRLPARLPVWSTITLWLFLDRLHAPGWLWGVFGIMAVFGWVVSTMFLFKQRDVDPFPPEPKA